jgi:hypothetical protein
MDVGITNRTSRARGTRASLGTSLLLLLLAVLAAMLLMEAGLRVAGIEFPAFYTWDPGIGNVLRPGASGQWRDEGRSTVTINADGMRDRAHAVAKPPDTFRVAVLGDSYAEAFQVPASAAFWAVLERELGSCNVLRGRRVEVLNFGVSGYGTGSELLTLRKRIWKYDPDHVVLAFFTGNDLRNNVADLEGDPRRAYFELRDDQLRVRLPEESRQRAPVLDAALNWLLVHSRVVQLVRRGRADVERLLANDAAPRDDGNSIGEAGLDNWIYREPDHPAHEYAWQLTQRLIGQMNSEVRDHGARFSVAIIGTGIQVNPDPAARARFARSVGAQDLDYADRRLSGFLAEDGVAHISLIPELRRWAEANRTCVHGFSNAFPCSGHWNEHGHRLAGALMAREICEEAGRGPVLSGLVR